MRPNVVVAFSAVALVAITALAVQKSPNFSSQTTSLTILTADSPDYRSVVIPLPYREAQRTIRAPVPAHEIATAWMEQVAETEEPETAAKAVTQDERTTGPTTSSRPGEHTSSRGDSPDKAGTAHSEAHSDAIAGHAEGP